MKNADEKEQAYPDIAYEIAKQNTCQNENGTPVISKDDECTEETEWDDLFEEMKRTLWVLFLMVNSLFATNDQKTILFFVFSFSVTRWKVVWFIVEIW